MTDVINSSQVFNLTCRSRGHPKPTIQWFKEDTNLQDAKDFYFIEVSTLPVDIYSYEVTSMLTFKGMYTINLDFILFRTVYVWIPLSTFLTCLYTYNEITSLSSLDVDIFHCVWHAVYGLLSWKHWHQHGGTDILHWAWIAVVSIASWKHCHLLVGIDIFYCVWFTMMKTLSVSSTLLLVLASNTNHWTDLATVLVAFPNTEQTWWHTVLAVFPNRLGYIRY